MKAAGLGRRKHTLDNEALDAFKQYIRRQQIQFELVPPGNHRRNQAERAIQTFKLHFISILAGVDNKFPLSLWCHFLEPMELTLNLLRQSKVAPKISAFAHVHGPHDYMKKPFAPLGCAIQAHVNLEDWRTWDTQSDAGFCLGTSMQHHQCFWVYITKTRATRISNHVTCSKISQCSSCCGKNFPGKSILKVWLLVVWKVSQLAYMNSSMSWIHLYMTSFIQWIFVFNEFMCIRNS